MTTDTTNKKDRFTPKGILLAAICFMMLGTLLELYLLSHYEDGLQLIPIICILLSAVLLMVSVFKPSKIIRRLFAFLMISTAFSGVFGIFLHLQVNVEFEQEMTPTLPKWDLFVESLSGAIPALAPGSLIVLALIGYSYLKLTKN